MIKVTVAYAPSEKKQVELPMEVENNCSVIIAIKKSGIINLFPEIGFPPLHVGIFGKEVPLDHTLRAGDRIEIYRPLQIDPKQARHARAATTRTKR